MRSFVYGTTLLFLCTEQSLPICARFIWDNRNKGGKADDEMWQACVTNIAVPCSPLMPRLIKIEIKIMPRGGRILDNWDTHVCS